MLHHKFYLSQALEELEELKECIVLRLYPDVKAVSIQNNRCRLLLQGQKKGQAEWRPFPFNR